MRVYESATGSWATTRGRRRSPVRPGGIHPTRGQGLQERDSRGRRGGGVSGVTQA